HDEWTLRRQDHLRGAVEGSWMRNWSFYRVDRQGFPTGGPRRDGFRQLQMDRPRPFLHCYPEAVADDGWDRGGADDLARHLGQRLHRGDNVHDLETRLTRRHDRLLAGAQD